MQSDGKGVKHTKTGNYRVAELVPPGTEDLTVEQLLTILVSRIVNCPDDMEVIVVNSGRVKVIEFDVPSDQRGPILGRSGHIIQAVRSISKALLGPRAKLYSYRVDLTGDGIHP